MQTYTPLEYTRIALANAFGLDKEVWQERLKFTGHVNSIKTLKESNFTSLIDKAKDPYMYTVWLKEYTAILEAKDKGDLVYLCNKPMSLDATCSNGQIAALLLRCPVTAANTNLINTGERTNLHQKVMDYVQNRYDISLNSDHTKTAIVSAMFGSIKNPEKLLGKDSVALKGFFEALHKYVPAAMRLLNISRNIWDSSAVQYTWKMEDGFEVVYDVVDTVPLTLEISGVLESTVYRAKQNTPKKKSGSLSAHIAHSVESWMLRIIRRNAAAEKIDLLTIHDDFRASPANMQRVRQLYLDAAVHVAKRPVLQDILRQITNQPKLTINLEHTDMWIKVSKAEYALS